MKLLNFTINYIIQHRRSISAFLTVGLLSAIIYFGTFTALWKFYHFKYQHAVSIAFACSIVFHFCANRYFTFKSITKNILEDLFRYSIMSAFNYMITLIIMYIVVEKFQLSPYLGIVISIASTVNIGYLLSRYWVFQPSRL